MHCAPKTDGTAPIVILKTDGTAIFIVLPKSDGTALVCIRL
jgi:hypothetical protein